jgi:hypothetical protein
MAQSRRSDNQHSSDDEYQHGSNDKDPSKFKYSGGGKKRMSKPVLPRGTGQKDDSSRDTRGYLVTNSSTLKTNNLSTGVIRNKFTNQGLIDKSYRELTNETIEIELTISIIVKRLEAQAQVFALKLRSIQDLNLKRILNVNENKWDNMLEQAYIYSYFRGLLYALTDSRVAERPIGKSALIGHEILQRCLLKSSWTFEHKESYIRYFFNVSEKDLDSIYKIAKTYPFIKDHMSLKPRFFLENEKLDRILDELHAHAFPGGPIFVKIGNDPLIDMYLTKDNFPIANSFYTSRSKEDEWLFAYSEQYTILDGSILFGKTCFVTSVNDVEVKKFYDQINKDDDLYLVKYEVSSTCGSTYPNPKRNFILGK